MRDRGIPRVSIVVLPTSDIPTVRDRLHAGPLAPDDTLSGDFRRESVAGGSLMRVSLFDVLGWAMARGEVA